MRHTLIVTLILFISSSFVYSQESKSENMAIEVLNRFQQAIVDNNTELASSLLHDEALILESGGMETKSEYLSHHFHSDGKFLSAMERKVISREAAQEGSTIWVSTVSEMKGTYNDRDIAVNSAELAVLVSTDEGWKISALHWSSRSSR
ncbi:MAG: nuclear transport factor 2 family protein [Balneolaceae bacterium]|nr:nuclear transport factor 2 family protein [Balneolaceae bacterium]